MKVVNLIRNTVKSGNLKVSSFVRRHSVFAPVLVGLDKKTDRMSGRPAEKEIEKTINHFRPGISQAEFVRYKNDIWYCRAVYLIDPEEYFLYDFETLDDDKRHAFVGNREKELLCRKINTNEAWKVFTDKWVTYQKFRDFYGREVIHISEKADLANLTAFIDRHKKAIIKPSSLSRGRGIMIVDSDSPDSIEKAVGELTRILEEGGSAVAEELIRQSEQTAVFHPKSVNTVRFTTFLHDGRVTHMMCVFRMGMGDSNVDNGGAGGICASVDVNSGTVTGPGTRENGEQFLKHPESGADIVGFRIPRWEELISTVDTLANILPEQKYVGWDLALTDQGWVMVEGNSWGQFEINQMSSKTGMREIIDTTFGAAIKKGASI